MSLATPAPTRRAPAARARIGGLDGLRAIAVVGVILYHAGVDWFHGGFIGVDIFFVLSGYLVTTIVMDGLEKRGNLGFRQFWANRFRRLEPAQLTMMVVITLAVAIGWRDLLSTLRPQIIAGVTGTMNWYLIMNNSSYFEQAARAPLFRHLWSLAIELQFYLVWPLALVALAKRYRDRVSVVAGGLAVAIVASAIYMAILYPGAGNDPSRAYFDTFSRIQAPLMGALLALLWRPRALSRARAGQHGTQVTIMASVSLVLLVLMMHLVNDRDPFMYRGGFFLTALLSAVVVAGLVHPSGALGGPAALGSKPMVAIGLRSYGLYLWHWPIFVLLRPDVDTDWSWGTVFVIRIALTVGLTEICYRMVERPWHTRSPSASWSGFKHRLLDPSPTPAPRILAIGSALACVLALVIIVIPHKANTEITDSLEEGQAFLEQQSTNTIAGGGTTTTVEDDGSGTPTTTLPVDPEPGGPVSLVGDSVMVGAAPTVMEEFGTRAIIDAKVSRQAADIPPVIDRLKAEGKLGPTVVVQVGINGTVTEDNLHDIVDAAEGRRVLIINARVPRPWQDGNNKLLDDLVPDLTNAGVIDWYDYSDGHRDWFLDDGVHLTEDGRKAYADLIMEAVDGKGASKKNDATGVTTTTSTTTAGDSASN